MKSNLKGKINVIQGIFILLIIFGLWSVIQEGPIERVANEDIEYFFVYTRIMKSGFASIILGILTIWLELKKNKLD